MNWKRKATALVWLLTVGVVDGASITGRVSTADTGLNVEGAQVEVMELDRRVTTERGGRFVIGDLPPGDFVLEVRFLGYETLRREISLEAGEEREMALVLEFQRLENEDGLEELAEMVVTGATAGTAKAANLKRNADGILDVISSDAFGRFVDRNVAEALSRLPGVTVEDSQGEGKFINIRGLESIYNPVTINGVAVATPEEDGRSVGLNIVATEQLERIEVKKTWLPKDSANTFGGTVNLVTRSALDRDRTFASLESAIGDYEVADDRSWRANAVYGTVLDGPWDWRIGVQVSANFSENNRGSETLETDGWETLAEPDLRNPPRGFVIDDLALEDYRIRRERVGYGGTLEVEFDPDHRLTLAFSQNRFNDDEIRQETEFNISNNVNSYTGLKTLTVDLAAELGVDPSEVPRDLTFAEAEALGDIAYDPEFKNFTFYRQEVSPDKSWRNTVTDDEITTTSLKWRKRWFDAFEIRVEGRFSEARKDWERLSVSLDGDAGGGSVTIPEDGYQPFVQGGQGNNLLDPEVYRLNRNLGGASENEFFSEETREGGKIDLIHTAILGESLKMKTEGGGDLDLREKAFQRDFNSFSEVETSPLPELRLSDDIFFGGDDLRGFLEDHGDYRFGPYFNDDTTPLLFEEPDGIELIRTPNDINNDFTGAVLRNYEATEDITAYYLMQTLTWKQWKLIYGFRYEETENAFTNNQIDTRTEAGQFISPGIWRFLDQDDFSEQVRSTRKYDHFLPALHLQRTFGERLILRASATHTIARPKFDELVPREIINIDGAQFGRSVQLPNLDLRPAESINYDLGVDFYLGRIDLVSLTLFYKEIDGVVFTESRILQPGEGIVPELVDKYVSSGLDVSPWRTSRKANTGPGHVFGAEISLEKQLGFLPSPLDGLGINFNVSLADSEVELLLEERFRENVPLFKQSDLTGNLSLLYEKYGFFLRIGAQYRSDYLLGVTAGRETIGDITREDRLNLAANSLDLNQDDRFRVDLTARYQVNEHLSFFYEGTNLNNEPRRRFLGNPTRMDSVQYTEPVHFAGARWVW